MLKEALQAAIKCEAQYKNAHQSKIEMEAKQVIDWLCQRISNPNEQDCEFGYIKCELNIRGRHRRYIREAVYKELRAAQISFKIVTEQMIFVYFEEA